jgi:uncharacterized delta-60 repeat protein
MLVAVLTPVALARARDFVIDQSHAIRPNVQNYTAVFPEGGHGPMFWPTLPELDVIDLAFQGFDAGTTVNLRAGEITGPIVGTSLPGVRLPASRGNLSVVQFDFASPVSVVPGDTYFVEPVPTGYLVLLEEFFRIGHSRAGGFIYRTSFEGTVGGPNTDDHFVWFWSIAGQNGWSVPVGHSSSVTISSQHPNAGESAVEILGLGLRPAQPGIVAAVATRSSDFDPIASGNPIVTMQASVRLNGPSTNQGNGISDDLISANTVVRDENGAIVAQLLMSSNGYAYAFADNGADAYHFPTLAALGEYHTVGLRLDYEARTTDFFLDDQPLGTLPFGDSIQSRLFAQPSLELVALSTVRSDLYSASFDDFSVHVAPVPEPASLVLLLTSVGLLTFIGVRRRFRVKARADRTSAFHGRALPRTECLEPRTLLTGALDLTFSGDGLTTVDFGGVFDQAWSVAQQPDGKLVVAGVNRPAGANQTRVALARFNPDGSLDDGGPLDSNPVDRFGVAGKVLISVGAGSATTRDVAIQADGKIVVVGGAQGATNGDFFVARLNADGSLDDGGPIDDTPGDAFGSNGGVVLLDFGFGSDDASAVAIQRDGRIIVGGLATIDTQLHWAFGLARYNTDGSPDNGTLADGTLGDQFGVGGKVVHRFGLANAVLQDLVVDTRSGISQVVAVGYAGDNSNFRFAVARYDVDGALDPAFDGDGQVVTEFARGNNVFRSVAIQPDGRIVAAGQALMASGLQGLVARYDTDGKLDLSFGNVGQILGSGLQPIPIQPTPGVFAGSASSLVLQPNGKIIVGLHGFLLPPGGNPEAGDSDPDFLLMRLNVDGGPDDGGSLDTTPGNSFGTGGVINTNFGIGVRSGDQIERLVIQSDGKLVAAGTANRDFAIARYVIETGVAGSAPIAQDDLVLTPPNTPRFVDVLDNDLDFDLDVLVVDSVTQPAHGTAEITAGGTGIFYRPANDFVGTDQFDYVVSDGRGGTDTATVTVTVNAPPIAFGYENERPHGAIGAFTIAAPGVLECYVDDESDPVTASIVAGPRHGTVVLRADGSFTYTPTTPDGRVLPDFFTYRLHDGHAFSNVAAAEIDVANRTPVAFDVTYSEPHGASAPLLGGFGASVIDGDSDPLTFTVVDEPRFGRITIDGFGFRYDPFIGRLNGPDSFTFRAHDGYAFSNVATVTIDIPNERPDARDDIFDSLVNGTGSEPVEGNVRSNDYDLDNDSNENGFEDVIVDPLRALLMIQPEHGLVIMSENGSFTYTPFAGSGLFGSDTFFYRITDGYEEDIASVTIRQVLPDPIVRSDSYTVARGDVLDVPGLGVLGNDSFGNLVLGSNVHGVRVTREPFFIRTGSRASGTLSSANGVIDADDPSTENTSLLDDNGGFRYEPGVTVPAIISFEYQFLYTQPSNSIQINSPEASVLIAVTETPHADADGVPDNIEGAVPHFAHGDINGDGVDDSLQFIGDGNGDGVFDRHQTNVASLQATLGNSYITLESSGRTKLFDVQAIRHPSPSDAPLNVQWPLGFFSYQVVGLAPGEGSVVTIYPHSDVVINSYYKYGKEPRDDRSTTEIDERLDEHWYEFSFDERTATGAEYFDDDNDGFTDRVVLHLVDGERGDDDYYFLEPNGVILDPGGPAFFQATAAPRIDSIVINDGSIQRSKVNSITVTFDSLVTIDAGAFELQRHGVSTAIGLIVSLAEENGRTVAVLTFGGRGVIGGSLFDGQYTLTIRGDKIRDALGQQLDGDGDGSAGGDRHEDFFRRYGDSDGDGDVDRFDRDRFLSTFLRRTGDSQYLWYFDVEDDGRVGLIDLLAFAIADFAG